MPNYDFHNSKTDEVETHFIKMSELDQFKEDNPHLKQRLSAPRYGDSVRLGVSKTPESWNQLLKNVGKRYKGSTIETR